MREKFLIFVFCGVGISVAVGIPALLFLYSPSESKEAFGPPSSYEIRKKLFLITRGKYRGKGGGVEIGGRFYKNGTALDVIETKFFNRDKNLPPGSNIQYTFVGYGGKKFVVRGNDSIGSSHVKAFPWDFSKNLPTGASRNFIVRYFHRFSIFCEYLRKNFFFIFIFLITPLYIYLAFYEEGKRLDDEFSLWLVIAVIFSLFLLLWGGIVGRGYGEYFDLYEKTNVLVESKKVSDKTFPGGSYFRPLEGISLEHKLDGWPDFANLFWVPGFVIFHFLFFLSFRYFLRGVLNILKDLHYILVSHPTEKYIDGEIVDDQSAVEYANNIADSMDHESVNSIPPTFMSENQTKRAKAVTEKIKAEKRLMKEVLKRERTRAELREIRHEE